MKHKGKLAMVTGGSEGIGKEIALELIRQGADVLVFSRSNEKLQNALREFESARRGPEQRIKVHALDVTDHKATTGTLNAMVKEYGVPDYVINCAGYARPGYLTDLEIDHYQKMMDLNYFGIVNVCKALVPHLINAKKGHIVNTSSMAGFIGLFGYTGYCASKYAVVGFSEALRRELEHCNVKVSVLCPPNTKTPGLIEENKYKPQEVLATEEKAEPVGPDFIARKTVKYLGTNKFMIVPTFDGGMAYLLSRYAPKILHQFVKRPQ